MSATAKVPAASEDPRRAPVNGTGALAARPEPRGTAVNGGPRIAGAPRKMQKRAADLQGTRECAPDGEPLSFCKRLHLKELMALDLAEAQRNGLTRDHVADALSDLLQRRISKTDVDQYVAQSREDRALPAGWVLAWTMATRSSRVVEHLYREAREAIDPRVFELTELEERRAALASRSEELAAEVYAA